MEEGEKIAAILAVKESPADEHQHFIVLGTRKGAVKKTDLSAFGNPRAGRHHRDGCEEGDSVIAVEMSDGKEQVFIGTRDGMAIRFDETDVRPMGRTAYGVRGITLRDDRRSRRDGSRARGRHDADRHPERLRQAHRLEEYRVQSRGGVGIINIQTSDRNGKVVGIAYVHDDDELMLISQQGMILRMVTKDIRAIGRATQGVRLLGVEEGDEVVVSRPAGGA